ncbi:E3 ubiquitin-protein ligase MPSR1-like [Corylus avellana]|uniref:E3 ubiquitin-protein ligase MPSR1-like n=1 Tax=Corylus avellana TaxID=13451 RepID=UPI00286D5F7D|nr:E3 ubiquitin-protein ligase MPSR1-like [Corylus avellana]
MHVSSSTFLLTIFSYPRKPLVTNSSRAKLVAISYIMVDFPRDQHEWLDVEVVLGVTSEKRGPLPALRVSIEAMPRVAVTQEEAVAKECAICLDGYEVGGEAREMPCKHRFHSGCIERWLGLHGSCPVCRFAMPVEEGNVNNGGGEEEEYWMDLLEFMNQ